MKYAKVRFVPEDDRPYVGRVFVNDQEVENVRYLRFEHDADALPTVNLELNATYDLDELVSLEVTVPTETTTDAMKCIALTRQLDTDFEQKLLDRIYSALIDSRDEKCLYEKASSILDYLLEDY